MKLKWLVAVVLGVFTVGVVEILFVGLVLTPVKNNDTGMVATPSVGSPVSGTGSVSPSPVTNPTSTPTAGPATMTPEPTSTPTPGVSGGGVVRTPTSVATPVATPTPIPATPTPTPTPSAPACGSPNGACTTAQVAAHNSQSDCWVIYNGSYYIVTSFVNVHPGGAAVFNSSTCGHDISSYLNGSASTAGQQHTHSGSAYSILNSYKVGPVQ